MTHNTSRVEVSNHYDELILRDDRVKLVPCEESLPEELHFQLFDINSFHHESGRGREEDFPLPCLEVLQIQEPDLQLLLNVLLLGK